VPKLNKRVKSRNQMILGLTTPLTEKYTYKDPSKREAWESSIFLAIHYFSSLFSR